MSGDHLFIPDARTRALVAILREHIEDVCMSNNTLDAAYEVIASMLRYLGMSEDWIKKTIADINDGLV